MILWPRQFMSWPFFKNEREAQMVEFRSFKKENFQDVCDFLVELNEADKNHINWNWARFEWMYEHPEFDKESLETIGLWWDDKKVVGAAIYDMYFGEAFCGVLPEYKELYKEVLAYTEEKLRDDSGILFAIADDDADSIQVAEKFGFVKDEQTENMMKIRLDSELEYSLKEEFHIETLNPAKEPYEFSWILWQGFDHGTDREVFEQEDEKMVQDRPHLQEELSVVAKNEQGENVAYCCLWYDKRTSYAYVEPVCVAPDYRGNGIAKSIVYEALNRVAKMGAKEAYVISDMDFYKKLGFAMDKHFTFYGK